MKMGRKLTFEPQFRFALDGKPWAMVFWWRYYAIIQAISSKWILSTNYSLHTRLFSDTSVEPSQEIIRTTRYLAGALAPNYQINKYFGIGMYLFYNYGIEKYITRNTYMVFFQTNYFKHSCYKKYCCKD